MIKLSPYADYFALLGLPCSFALEEETLRHAYIEAQRRYHPDRTARATPQERAHAAGYSMEINQAYQTLKSPVQRADHLLHLAGIREHPAPSPTLLMESLEAREELEETNTRETLSVLVTRHHAAFEKELQHFSTLHAQGNMMEAATSALRLRYLEKLLEEIRIKSKMLAGNETKAGQ